jgi:hypothetical protein
MASTPASGGPKATPPVQALAAPQGGGGGGSGGAAPGEVSHDERGSDGASKGRGEREPTELERQEMKAARNEAVVMCNEAQDDLGMAQNGDQEARERVACHFGIAPDDPDYKAKVQDRIENYEAVKRSLSDDGIHHSVDDHSHVRVSPNVQVWIKEDSLGDPKPYIDEHAHIALGVKDGYYRQTPRDWWEGNILPHLPEIILSPGERRMRQEIAQCAPDDIGAESFQQFAIDVRNARRRSGR